MKLLASLPPPNNMWFALSPLLQSGTNQKLMLPADWMTLPVTVAYWVLPLKSSAISAYVQFAFIFLDRLTQCGHR